MTGSSSRALSSSPEFLLAFACPRALPPRAPSLGFVPSSRRHRGSPLSDGRPRPVYVPPTAFRTLATVCSSPDFARLFHRAAMSRVLAPGVDLTNQPHHLVGDRCPRAVSAVRLPVSRLQRTVRDLRALLRSVSYYPSCFSTPSGFGPRIWEAPSRLLRSRPSRYGTACPPHRWPPASQSIRVLLPLSPEALTCSSFVAFESVALLARPKIGRAHV